MEATQLQLENCDKDKVDFYESVVITLKGAIRFIERYENLANELASFERDEKQKSEYLKIATTCKSLKDNPASGFRQAVQSIWFLYVILQMESNASSFSPGRMDQYLYPYYKAGIDSGEITNEFALEILECLWLKFNQIVYLRSSAGAKYFAGFPIGFNVALGGQKENGEDASNELSFLFLKAQSHLGLPQPNLSARLFAGSPDDLVLECAKVIGKGSGMPQVFNDEAVIPALMKKGIAKKDATNYAIVGFAELEEKGHINCFFVHHKHQGKGVGRILTSACIDEAKALGYKKIVTEVSITAKPFFLKMGFKVIEPTLCDISGLMMKYYIMTYALTD